MNSLHAMAFLFPKSHPDELFVSLVSRYHWHVVRRHTRSTLTELFGIERWLLTRIVPPDIWRLAKQLPGDSAQNFCRLLERNTLYPLYSLFYGISPDLPENEGDIPKIQSPRRAHGQLDTWICLSCLKDDLFEVGTPYIHRAHQVPGVRVCHRHEEPLIEKCPSCQCPFEKKGDLFFVPWRLCQCEKMMTEMPIPPTTSQQNTPELEYARFAQGLLSAPLPRVSFRNIPEVYQRRLKQLGLTRGENISHERTLAALEDYYGPESLALIDRSYGQGQTNKWLRLLHISDPSAGVPLTRHLLLANFLFKSAAEFLADISHATPRPVLPSRLLPDEKTLSGSENAPNEGRRISKCLDRIHSAMAMNPHITLKDLWKKYPGSLRLLLKLDTPAFEKLQQEISSGTFKRKLERKADIADPLDPVNAEALKQAALRLYASKLKPKRVTKSELLRAVELKFRHSNPGRFPLSAQVIEEYSESWWHFSARRYIWAMTDPALSHDSTLRWKSSGVHFYAFSALERMFSGLAFPSALKEGRTLAILGGYGIDRKWVGPNPEKPNIKIGRGYSPVIPSPKSRKQGPISPKVSGKETASLQKSPASQTNSRKRSAS